MSKRLEEIKKSFNFWMKEDESIGLLPEDIQWLIEQAERVQELEEELTKQKELRKKCFFDLYKTKEMYGEVKNNYMRECKQNKRYREALELLVKQETIGNDVKTGKTAISYNGMIALKGLGVFNDDNYIVYGLDEIIESVLEESE